MGKEDGGPNEAKHADIFDPAGSPITPMAMAAGCHTHIRPQKGSFERSWHGVKMLARFLGVLMPEKCNGFSCALLTTTGFEPCRT